jgi:hypothetical protein
MTHLADSCVDGSLMLREILSPFGFLHDVTERYLGRRDGILVAIALELYRRQYGSYPDSLDQLTPALLPHVPADRITGQPLRYRLIDGKPIVYSIGADRDDDGGSPPVTKGGEPAPLAAAWWEVPKERACDGDWVIYPEPEAQTSQDQ